MTPAQARALERAGRRVVEAVQARNRLIREMAAEGASVREIASAVKTIGYSRVHLIVKAGESDGELKA